MQVLTPSEEKADRLSPLSVSWGPDVEHVCNAGTMGFPSDQARIKEPLVNQSMLPQEALHYRLDQLAQRLVGIAEP